MPGTFSPKIKILSSEINSEGVSADRSKRTSFFTSPPIRVPESEQRRAGKSLLFRPPPSARAIFPMSCLTRSWWIRPPARR